MALTKEQIQQIAAQTRSSFETGSFAPTGVQCLFDDVHDAIDTAIRAQHQLMDMSLEERGKLIEAMRVCAREHAEELAILAHEETGYGKVPHKIAKNLLAANKTPGIEDLHPTAFSGDNGLTLVETAPYGVIGAITPSTNPTATIINNSISMISAGNAVVYNPHPAAKRASQKAMELLNEAIVKAGGPNGLMTAAKEPTLDTSKVIMTHKAIKMLAVTGGEAVVGVAMKSGKKCVAAGPGNPPVIVDETADIAQAAKDIVDGASFDNNVLCVAEKEVFMVNSIADSLMNTMEKCGAYRVYGEDIDKIVRTVLIQKDGKYVINRKFVGHDATYILRACHRRCRPLSSVCRGRDAHAGARHGPREQLRRGAGRGLPRRAWLPALRDDPFLQRAQHVPCGPPHEHDHLRQECPVLLRSGLRRRGLHHADHRHPDRRGPDEREVLYARKTLCAEGRLPHHLRRTGWS